MALRLSTVLEIDTSAEWQPNGETIIQADYVDGDPVVTVRARVDPSAPWQDIGALYVKSESFKRFAQMPYLQVVVSKNKAGARVRVWDNQ